MPVVLLDADGASDNLLAYEDAVVQPDGVGAELQDAQRVGAHLLLAAGVGGLVRGAAGREECRREEEEEEEEGMLHSSAYSDFASKQGQALAAKSRCP